MNCIRFKSWISAMGALLTLGSFLAGPAAAVVPLEYLALPPKLIEDFDGNGNTPYNLTNSLGTAPSLVQGNDAGKFLRLVDISAISDNALSFDVNPDTTGRVKHGKILSWDFRMSAEASAGEGMAVGYFASPVHGLTGGRNPGFTDPAKDWERPSFLGAVTVGMDVHPGIDVITMNAFGTQIAEMDVAPKMNLNDGKWHRAHLLVQAQPNNPTQAFFNLDIIEDIYGVKKTHNILIDVPANINVDNLPDNRVMAGARTSADARFTADIDNVTTIVIPEPASGVLGTFAGLATLAAARRRSR